METSDDKLERLSSFIEYIKASGGAKKAHSKDWKYIYKLMGEIVELTKNERMAYVSVDGADLQSSVDGICLRLDKLEQVLSLCSASLCSAFTPNGCSCTPEPL